MNNYSSKINSLLILKKKLKSPKIRVPKFIYFTKKDFLKNKNKIFFLIKKNFNKEIIIRSASLSEDNESFSNAGKYKSFSNIKINRSIIFNKINKVIKEFKNPNDQVIIQHFEKKVSLSGVIFTRDPNTNAPYYIINYDESGRTDLITSGKFNPSIKTLIIYNQTKKIPEKFSILISSINKIRDIFKDDRLDIEFGIEKKTNKILLFQCRKLFKFKNFVNYDDEIKVTLNNIKKKIIKLKKINPYISGNTSLFSNMADWNPAEMIGSKPKTLAISLYSELITDHIWSLQRKNYGYKNVYPNNLMINFAGMPFIDIRTDFNSFLPKDLTKNTENKIINYLIKKLQNNPNLHDKIEFNIVPTCYDFDDTKENFSLSKKDLKLFNKKIKNLTFNILNENNKLLDKEKKKIELLQKKIETIKESDLSHIQKIYYLVKDCKKFGTLPFAGLARCAFISTKIIKTLQKKNIISENQNEIFFNNLNSITKEIDRDFQNFLYKKNTKKKFIEKYGHLRPQTYSIKSENYRTGFKKYFKSSSNKSENKKIKKENFKLTSKQNIQLKKLFLNHGLKIKNKVFFQFAKRSIELREWSKFIFTKSINEIFENLKNLSNEIKVPINEFEHLSIKTILNYNSSLDYRRIKNLIKKEIDDQKKSIIISNQIKLPDLIINEKNLDYFYLKDSLGNYITNKSITGKIIYYDNIKKINNLKDKIIFIENADPGYDFLFSKKISGLVTKFGGANSHMAIRCMELQIPAIIGLGEKNFNHLKNINTIYINCDQSFFKVIN